MNMNIHYDGIVSSIYRLHIIITIIIKRILLERY